MRLSASSAKFTATRFTAVTTALAMVVATSSGTWAQQAPSGPPVKVGLIAELTGPMGFYGTEIGKTSELITKQINAAGGLAGRPVELLVRDSKTNVADSVRQARDLLFTENVDFIMAGVNSAECVAIGNLAKQAKKVFFANCANEDVTGKDGNDYVFRVPNITTQTQGSAAAQYIHDKLPTRGNRIYTIGHDFAFGRLTVAAFKERMKSLNPKAEFIGESWPKASETDYTSFITAMIEAKPDVVFFVFAIGIPFLQQAAPFELPKKFAMVATYWGGTDELQVLPKAAVPVDAVMAGFPWYAIDNAANAEFMAAYRKENNNKPPFAASYVPFMSWQALRAGVAKANSIEPEKVIAALQGLQFDSVVGPVTIRPFDHQGTMPYWMGKVAFDNDKNIGVITDIVKLPTADYLPTEEQIRKVRQP